MQKLFSFNLVILLVKANMKIKYENQIPYIKFKYSISDLELPCSIFLNFFVKYINDLAL